MVPSEDGVKHDVRDTADRSDGGTNQGVRMMSVGFAANGDLKAASKERREQRQGRWGQVRRAKSEESLNLHAEDRSN